MTDPKLTWTIANATLRNLYPPSAVVHVGAGQGIGKIHAWRDWDVELGLCIEADASRTTSWQDRLSPDARGRMRVIHAIAGPTDGPGVFHRASNPAEDGLVAPQTLSALWPQLKCVESRPVETLSIDSIVLSEVDEGDVPNAWLIVDCFPADALLEGARALLQRTNIVVARTRADECTDGSFDFLRMLGFTPFGSVETNHPGVQHLLWVRSPAALKDQLQQSADALDVACHLVAQATAVRDDTLTQNEQVAASLNEQLATAQKLREERDRLHELCEERRSAVETVTQQHSVLAAERDLISRNLGQRESALASANAANGQLISERDSAVSEHLAAVASATARIEQLENALAVAERRGQQWLEERDTHAALAAERQGIVSSLEQARAAADNAFASEQRARQDALVQRDQESQAKSASVAEAEALKVQVEALQNDLQAMRTRLQEREVERDEAARRGQGWLAERDANAALAAERQGIIASLEQVRAAAETALASEQRARQDALVQRDQESQAKSASVAEAEALKAQVEALQNDLQALRTRLQEREAERDEAARRGQGWLAERDANAALAAERQGIIASLEQARAAAETALASEQRARQDALVQRDLEIQAKSASVAEAEALKAQVEALQNGLEALRTRLQDLEASREEAVRLGRGWLTERDAHAALATERQGIISSLEDTLASTEGACTAEQLTKQDALVRLEQEALARAEVVVALEALQAQIAASSSDVLDLRTRLQQLQAERDAVIKAHEETIATLKAEEQASSDAISERDLLRRQLEDQQTQVQKQQVETVEVYGRQRFMHQEIIKAEAQIELIKDLMLREPGL
jgi:hypothetical protein